MKLFYKYSQSVLKDTLIRRALPQTDRFKWSLLFFYYIVWLSVGGDTTLRQAVMAFSNGVCLKFPLLFEVVSFKLMHSLNVLYFYYYFFRPCGTQKQLVLKALHLEM